MQSLHFAALSCDGRQEELPKLTCRGIRAQTAAPNMLQASNSIQQRKAAHQERWYPINEPLIWQAAISHPWQHSICPALESLAVITSLETRLSR